jgi:integrase
MRSAGSGVDWARRCATVLTSALDLARRLGLINSNPAKDASRPKLRRSKPFSPARDDVVRLLSVATASDPEVGAALTLVASTGLRKGELLALRWSDVDLQRREISVSASVSDGGPGVGVVVKENEAIRLARCSADVCSRPGTSCLRHDSSRVNRSRPDDHVLSADGGRTPLRPDSFSDRVARVRGGIEITVQDLRHFAATIMLDAGESYRTVAHLLGNSENTLRIHYDGRTDVGERRAVSALEF